MSRKTAFLGSAALLLTLASSPAQAEETRCNEGRCVLRLTAAQLLQRAQKLVFERNFAEAAPMIAALENAPELAMERQFLSGYVAVETGDLKTAVGNFRSVLASHPEQTRVRLELARALMLQGKNGAADHHFRLAQSATDLPPEIAATIRASRGIIRSQRDWSLNVDFGFAPDSNITNGTTAETIDIAFGNQIVPLTLDESARSKTGTGQTIGLSGSARLNLKGETNLLIEGDAHFVNYKGSDFDDLSTQLAIGPEFQLSDTTRLSVQALGAHRLYAGKSASLAGGARATLSRTIGENQRISFSLDARNSQSGFSQDYSGWQIGSTLTYERVISRALIASASLFARRDALNSASYSGTEIGANVGIGGELPHGITAGISAGISRSIYDAAIPLFGEARHDWRLNARVQLGLRTIRVLGFSPSVTFNFTKNASNLALYDSERQRFQFALAHYF